jgi:thymidylate synthase (FAD)
MTEKTRMIQVGLIDKMGSDLSVVNAARVSFSKVHLQMEPGDERLIKYLADHQHWSPFAHTSLQFHIKAPVFVARQLAKHQVGLVWNEVSRRYVSEQPSCHSPDKWRKAADDKKQGSTDQAVQSPKLVSKMYDEAVRTAVTTYDNMIELGVCPEQARAVLPQSMYTEWYWTGSLYAFSRVCKLRLAPDAQQETREVALKISETCATEFPVSWKYL